MIAVRQAASTWTITAIGETMLQTRRKPALAGEIITGEFLDPLGLKEEDLAEAMGMTPDGVHELCAGRLAITAPTALILARVFGNSAEFWLNVQRRHDLWTAMNSPEEIDRVARAKPLIAAA